MEADHRRLEQELAALGRERGTLAARARVVGGARRRSGYRVTAWLTGPAQLEITYLVSQARWTPAYDLQLRKDQQSLRVAFNGAVSQETGEDWNDARLILSTAMPATIRALPELATWKLGDRERFVPQSRRVRPPALPPGLPLPPPAQHPRDESEGLRRELLQRAQAEPATGRAEAHEDRAASLAPAGTRDLPPPPAPPPSPVRRGELAAPEREADEAQAMEPESRQAPFPQTMVASAPMPMNAAPPAIGVGIAPPAAWRPSPLPPGSPADAAGGYELEYASERAETIASGAGARRVVLFTETWPVAAERVLFPAVAAEAFLTARLRNPSQRTLPRAQAQLTVGDDLAGSATVPLSRPGAEVELPLGVDRALHPQRNVAQLKGEEGIFSKDEITRYLVTIEISNPYAAPIALRVIDQYPLIGDNHIEVQLLEAPRAQVERETGKLTWALQLAPAEKVKLAFTYQLKRPRGFKVNQ